MLPRLGQGEALATWGLWGLVALATLVTYSRLEPAQLYNVSVDGLAGGLGRVVVFLNYPFALVAIALALVALAALPGRSWWLGAPAIALCAVVAVPGVVEQADLDASTVNALPALGVALAAGLTVAATMRAGAGLAPGAPWDTGRVVLVVVILLMSLPWVAAELGFYLPGDVFLGEEPWREPDGTPQAAVHYGRHHGFDGSLLVVSALLLSRFRRPGRLSTYVTAYLGLMLAYGSVNMVQDLWGEQVLKRGWIDTGIPSAIVPRLHWIWALILALAVLFTWALRVEQRRRETSRRVILGG
jgi:hypothetical protein